MRNAIFFSVSLLAGCSASTVTSTTHVDRSVPADLLEDFTVRSVWDGTPEGIGALAFLNDESTTFGILDFAVPLDRRAAENLIEHRDGRDGRYGTKDDDRFDFVKEVDGVRWVGPKSIDRIIAYADAEGWVPTQDDELGTWDQVTFTVNEAELTLELVNTASVTELDDEVPLDRRAVNSIVDARPLSTVAELAGLYYVGKSALGLLKFYAEDKLGEVEVEEVEEVEEAFEDQFVHDEELDIPDNDPTGIDARNSVGGVPDIAVEIKVLGDFLHDAPEELEIHLVAPNGEEWNLTNGLASFNEVIAYSDDPNGYWTLNVADTVAGNEGTLWGWALEINSVDTTTAAGDISVRFTSDLSAAVGDWYTTYGADVAAMGGASLADAQAAISVGGVSEVLDGEDDPYGHDLATTLVLTHPDVVFPGGDSVWFGAYDRATLSLIEIYSFE